MEVIEFNSDFPRYYILAKPTYRHETPDVIRAKMIDEVGYIDVTDFKRSHCFYLGDGLYFGVVRIKE